MEMKESMEEVSIHVGEQAPKDRVVKIESVNVTPSDIIVVTVDTGKMPKSKAEVYLRKISDDMNAKFPNNEVWIIPQNVDISVLHMVEYPVV